MKFEISNYIVGILCSKLYFIVNEHEKKGKIKRTFDTTLIV